MNGLHKCLPGKKHPAEKQTASHFQNSRSYGLTNGVRFKPGGFDLIYFLLFA